jgi:hypothetical protein
MLGEYVELSQVLHLSKRVRTTPLYTVEARPFSYNGNYRVG